MNKGLSLGVVDGRGGAAKEMKIGEGTPTGSLPALDIARNFSTHFPSRSGTHRCRDTSPRGQVSIVAQISVHPTVALLSARGTGKTLTRSVAPHFFNVAPRKSTVRSHASAPSSGRSPCLLWGLSN